MKRDLDFDVVIVGGGAVGAALAAVLATTEATRGLTLALIEPQPIRMPEVGVPLGLRVSALSHASRALVARVGAWPRVSARGACAYERMVVWDASTNSRSMDALTFDAGSLGVADLGCIVENAALNCALLEVAVAAGVVLLTGAVTELVLNDDVAHVRCGERRFKTSLVIAADGVDSPVRALAGFTGQGAAYAQEAVVAHLAPHEPHGAVARQRFLKTGPLALLPLADGRVSLVWSTTAIEAERLLAMTPAEFGAAVSEASDSTLGALTLASERARFALRHFQADRYMATRCVLVGDAAHSVHPLAGQGVNLGLLDVEALCRHIETALSRGADIGDARGLGHYGRERRAANVQMGAALDLIARLSATDGVWSRGLGRFALGFANRATPIKRALAQRALGL
jgi:ubiquinone biosynthesis UbiH/UbiF/VisC/COQ6 family hydroxylase